MGKHIKRENRKRAVINAHNEGLTLKQIAKKYKITVNTVRSYLREERIEAVEKRSEQILKRTDEMVREREAGADPKEIAIIHRVSYSTVLDSLREYRTRGLMPGATYKEITCPAQTLRSMRKWAKDIVATEVNTPEGKMTVAKVNPYNVECIRKERYGIKRSCYTLGDIYYCNHQRNYITDLGVEQEG